MGKRVQLMKAFGFPRFPTHGFWLGRPLCVFLYMRMVHDRGPGPWAGCRIAGASEDESKAVSLLLIATSRGIGPLPHRNTGYVPAKHGTSSSIPVRHDHTEIVPRLEAQL
jgi:hypothetical protein